MIWEGHYIRRVIGYSITGLHGEINNFAGSYSHLQYGQHLTPQAGQVAVVLHLNMV